ncbi:MAG TPA: protein kinase, partial [Planctomycetaceae bacterium]|nr:protein kinase [Planctomycetaceae bacterium]
MVMSSRLRSTVAMLSGGEENSAPPDTGWLTDRFRQLVAADTVEWSVQYRLLRRVGSGGQGVVYLAERLAVHNLTLPVALKVFSPESHPTVEHYRREMERIARIAGDLVLLQHDHLLDVYNFVLCDGVYVMVMEYVDGFDLHQLVQTEMAAQTRAVCDPQRWEQLTRVVFSEGKQLAFTPGIAVSILRHCLAAVGAMHRLRIVHGDLKPANIMVGAFG